MRELYTLLFLLILASSCSKDNNDDPVVTSDPNVVKEVPITECLNYNEIHVDSDIEFDEIIEFGNKYVLGGYDGFMVMDQNYNMLNAHQEPMYMREMVVHPNNFVCICSDNGIYKITQDNKVEKMLDLPCTDMTVDKEGRILFVSGLGILSVERQISANILELNFEEHTFSYYSNPEDSINVFLDQIEIMDNGEIWTLSNEASIFRYDNKSAIEKYSIENLAFFPPNPHGLNQQYNMKASNNELYFTAANVWKKLLRYAGEWEVVLDIDNWQNDKDLAIVKSYIFDMEVFNGKCMIATQNGFIRVASDAHEYDFIKDPNLSNQLIRKIYVTLQGNVILILPENKIVEINC